MAMEVGSEETTIGVAMLYLLSKSEGTVEVSTPEAEGNPNGRFGFCVTCVVDGEPIAGFGETVGAAAQDAMKQVPQ